MDDAAYVKAALLCLCGLSEAMLALLFILFRDITKAAKREAAWATKEDFERAEQRWATKEHFEYANARHTHLTNHLKATGLLKPLPKRRPK